MSETINNKKIFSLLEVTRSIQATLAKRYTSTFWVKAEMIRLNHYPHSGHCYPDLAEKNNGKVIAQLRANLWKSDYLRINSKFQALLKEPLKDGIKILFAAKITFDPMYGLSLHILDIDPGYTLGDLEKEKQETIARLKEEGLFDKNKRLQLPLLPQRIAVISVETSKGYADFRKVIENNAWGYQFFHFLFPALLQGEKAVESITRQLKRIEKVKDHFDVAAIIRGGGGDIGLSCYNNYHLAKEIASFPLPVITGIGHATNETVAEMIAFQNAITPTKMAEWLMQQFHDFSVPVQQAEEKITDKAERLLLEEKTKFQTQVKYFRSVTHNRLTQSHHAVYRQSNALVRQSGFLIRQAKENHVSLLAGIQKGSIFACNESKKDIHQRAMTLKKEALLFQHNQHLTLDNMQKNVNNLDPKNVLKRGYSITLLHHKAVTRSGQVQQGDMITTILSDGRLNSEIKSIQKPESHE